MEDILALVVATIFVAVITVAVRAMYKSYKKSKQEEAERRARSEKFWDEQRAKLTKVEVPESMTKYVNALGKAPEVKAPKTKSSYTSSTSRVESSDNSFVNGMLTQMLIDTTIESITHGVDRDTGKTYDREIERSVGVSKSESSWGFDDSDSRKSISDSMDTSSSWSSSSSDFGSSDSGPSSDW
jgi:hypothetical protein